jgi:hypothetical protein
MGRTRLPFAAPVLLPLASCCIGAWSPAPCLTGDDPRAVDAREQWTLADHATGIEQACALERVPSFFYDYSDQSDAPSCAPEFVARMAEAIFEAEPIEFTRVLLARIHAVGAVGDTTDVMPQKAQLLLQLAELSDAALTDYRPAPGETGPSPDKAFVRQLALFELASSNLYLNVAAARTWLNERLAAPHDDREALALLGPAREFLADTLWGHPAAAVDNGSFALLAAWIADVPRRCAGPWTPESFELLLVRLEALGYYGEKFGMRDAAREALDALLAARAEVALVEGWPAARHDLYVNAALARFDLDAALEGVSPPVYFRPLREQPEFDAGPDWIEPELYANRGVDCGVERDVAPSAAAEMAERLAAGLAGGEAALAAGRETLHGLLADAILDLEGASGEDLFHSVAQMHGIQLLGRWADAYGLSGELDALLARLESAPAANMVPSAVHRRAAVVARAERELAAEAAAASPSGAQPGI